MKGSVLPIGRSPLTPTLSPPGRGSSTRRSFLHSTVAAATATLLPSPALAQNVAHVVVIGGGFGGATCARALKQIEPKLEVTLVEESPTYTACPGSNAVIAGLHNLTPQRFTY